MNATKYIELHNSAEYRHMNARPDYLPELIQWLTAKLEEVPSEYHEHVLVEFTSSEHTCDVEECIYYFRPPTQEEIEADLEDARLRKEKREADERRQYEELKAKFDP